MGASKKYRDRSDTGGYYGDHQNRRGSSKEDYTSAGGLAGYEKVVMDLEKLEYISSSGLRQFVAAYKKLRNKLVFRNVSDNIMGILKTTGLDKRLVFE